MSAIGIHLGTSYSCVAVWQGGQVDIIPDDHGHKITPSYVAFTNTERLIGNSARHQIGTNPFNTIFNTKRLIGRKFADLHVQSLIKYCPFTVNDDKKKCQIQVNFHGQERHFYPEEISSIILEKMKKIAEDFLDKEVKDAVVTVPASFNDSQRQATKNAGLIAGLNVLRIINETTAAALAYGLKQKFNDKKTILIFKMGSGTTEVSIVKINNGLFKVVSTVGETNLGGDDFDTKLFNYLREEFVKKWKKNFQNNPRALRRLRIAAVNAKECLSESSEAVIDVDFFLDDIDLHTKISRILFEDICADLFKVVLRPVEQALLDAEIDKTAIDEVVLVGGSTRIPKVKSTLQDYFGEKLNLLRNPHEMVARGAAVQAAILSEEGKLSAILQGLSVREITPHTFGLELPEGLDIIIKKNTEIPCKTSRERYTIKNNQTEISLRVFGNDDLIGMFKFSGIEPGPAGQKVIDVIFSLDPDGILQVTGRARGSCRDLDIKITNDKGHRSLKQFNYMISEAKKYRVYESKQEKINKARCDLESYVLSMKQSARDDHSQVPEDDRNEITGICEEIEKWQNNYQHAGTEEYENMLDVIQQLFPLIMTRKERADKMKIKLKNYICSMKKNAQDDCRLSEDKKKQIIEVCDDTEKWLENNSRAEKQDYVKILKEIEQKCAVILSRSEESFAKSMCSVS